jgi:hypothetical protein
MLGLRRDEKIPMDFHASAFKNQTIIPHTTFSKTSTKKYQKV